MIRWIKKWLLEKELKNIWNDLQSIENASIHGLYDETVQGKQDMLQVIQAHSLEAKAKLRVLLE